VGQRLGLRYGENIIWAEVVGVVRNAESPVEIGNASTPYQTFRPITQEPWGWFRVALRCQNPAALADPMRKALSEIDPDLPATETTTVEQALQRQQHNLIIVGNLLTAFALLGLGLAAVGLYGVISNLVAQRTSEFGIRLALGATPGNILSLVLNHGLKLTLIGLVLGLGGAYGLSRLLNHIMPRLVDPDTLALAGMTVILFLVALFACWLPARRATKVDPMVALRAE
jgi:ABC-type lipoprotein release transport system permease subunit